MAVKGVIVAAGYGTRFLPVTRVVPKELLPIVDRPAIALVIDEMIEAGVQDLLVITSRRKRAIEDWFDTDPELKARFEAEHAEAKLQRIAPPQVRTSFIRQSEMGGTGHALLLAREFAGSDPTLVAFPDDLFAAPNACSQLLAVHEATGKAVLGALDLGDADVSSYGVIAATPAGEHLDVQDVIEKPAPGSEPSHLISVGRYLYTPALFDALATTFSDHHDGEFHPMPAMRQVAGAGGLVATILKGRRWDTGHPLGYLEAVVDHALSRPDLGPAFLDMLRRRLAPVPEERA